MSDPKRLFKDPDLTLKGILDPDPTLQVIPNSIPGPSQNLTFLPRKFVFEIMCQVSNNGTAELCSPIFEVFKFLLTSKFYFFDMNQHC